MIGTIQILVSGTWEVLETHKVVPDHGMWLSRHEIKVPFGRKIVDMWYWDERFRDGWVDVPVPDLVGGTLLIFVE